MSRWQEDQLVEQVDRRLRDAALLVGGDLAERMPAGRSEALQERVRRLGQETGIRFTLIAMDGKVLADSAQADLAEVAAMQNHDDRPEVVRAIAARRGDGGAHERHAG